MPDSMILHDWIISITPWQWLRSFEYWSAHSIIALIVFCIIMLFMFGASAAILLKGENNV